MHAYCGSGCATQGLHAAQLAALSFTVCVSAAQAAQFYIKAAQAGSVEGMYSLGWMHAVGQGVPHNTSHAAQLYKQAVTQAPDWQHAAPAFVALLLLPFLVALHSLQSFTTVNSGAKLPGEQKRQTLA